jgi:hypothetical protein
VKLRDALENYNYNSGKASDIARQLALGAIAIIWLFQISDGPARTLPAALFPPLKLIVAALAVDLAQYVLAAVLWSVFHRYKEGRVDAETSFRAPYPINWPSIVCFYGKISLVAAAYWHLWHFLANALHAGTA